MNPSNVLVPVEAREEQSHANYLLCDWNQVLIGIETSAVREILPLPEISPLPSSAPPLAGVVNVRGTLIPVVALPIGPRQDALTVQASDCLVVVAHEDKAIAVLMNAVRDVESLSAPAAQGLMGMIAGLVPLGGEVIQILAVAPLLALAAEAFTPRSPAQNESRALQVAPQDKATLHQRALALSQVTALDTRKAEQTLALAVFALGEEYFGLDLTLVREFALRRSLTPVPGTPADVAGLMNLRGEALVLLDIAPALGMTGRPNSQAAQVVIVECEDLRAGLLVDEVLDVFSVGTSEITVAPTPMREGGELLRGAVFYRASVMALLDVEKMLRERRRDT